MSPNQKAFLDTIAWSEIGQDLIAVSDNGYNVIVGSTAENPDLFNSYTDHPRKEVWLSKLNVNSSAAGRYQLLSRYFDAYKKQLDLPDFSPESQDSIALQQIRECHAINQIDAGSFDDAISRCARIWASLPGSTYKQHTNSIEILRTSFTNAGGVISK